MSATATPDVDEAVKLDEKTSFYKQYAIVVFNDDDHTFEYVVESFMKVFKYTAEKCLELAITIHKEGRALVWSGMLEHAELKVDQIKSCGPDLYAGKPVKYPLVTEIQPI